MTNPEHPRAPRTEGGSPDAAQPAVESTTAQASPRDVPWTKRVLRFFVFAAAGLFLAVFFYRWLGTSTVRGSVQRVYEKDAAYKVEFVDETGNVQVVENTPMRFPHFKLETADLQANLHHLATTHDIVDLTVWGMRLSWLDVFPNVVDVEFVRSNEETRATQVAEITKSVVDELIDQGIIERGQQAERIGLDLKKAVERALDPATPPAIGSEEPSENAEK